MRLRHLVVFPALTASFLAIVGASPAWAAPLSGSGTFQTIPGTFVLTPDDTTDPVRHFSFDLRATVTGPLAGTFSEHQECLRKGEVIRCHGVGTSYNESGEPIGNFHSHVLCNRQLVCTGKSAGTAVTEEGRIVFINDDHHRRPRWRHVRHTNRRQPLIESQGRPPRRGRRRSDRLALDRRDRRGQPPRRHHQRLATRDDVLVQDLRVKTVDGVQGQFVRLTVRPGASRRDLWCPIETGVLQAGAGQDAGRGVVVLPTSAAPLWFG